MSKAEWGMKRICPSCGMRYYDMKKKPPVCPKCKTVFDPENLLRARRGRVSEKKASKEVVVDDVIEGLPIAGGDEAEDALIEDAEELGDDPVEEVLEVEEES